ncbi:MAG TPA: hypothetical protein VHY22_00115 [Chthoniobacteraceae bacterium]|jgi:hypothetical protein|nr:hypothetical protein [Chthoniobacteraceae bacterium]
MSDDKLHGAEELDGANGLNAAPGLNAAASVHGASGLKGAGELGGATGLHGASDMRGATSLNGAADLHAAPGLHGAGLQGAADLKGASGLGGSAPVSRNHMPAPAIGRPKWGDRQGSRKELSGLPENLNASAIMPASRARVSSRAGAGRTLAMRPEPYWLHPWQITPRWDGTRQVWTSTIKAGFVNGECPVYVSTAAAAQSVNGNNSLDYGINPLDGQPFFSAWVFNQNNQGGTPAIAPATTVWLPLTSNPLIDLSWENIGFDDLSASNPLPLFFQNLGVTPATPIDPDNIDASAANLLAPAPVGNRLLRGCSLVLHQPRTGLASNVSIQGLNVTQTLTLSQIAPGDTLQVYAAASWSPETALADGIDPTTGDYTEPPYDEILIGTVYLLSPPNVAAGSAPDQTWQPYVQHAIFWNLMWAQPQPPSAAAINQDNSLSGLVASVGLLAGGVADVVVDSLADTIQDAYDNALNILEAYSMAGSFWTPASGGSTSLFPPVAPVAITVPPNGHGMDKNALIAAQQAAAALALASQQLDPDFPYLSIPFNTGLL